MIRRIFLILLTFACLLSLLLLFLAQNNSRYPPPLNRVAVWMPTSWDGERARASWQTNRAHIQELSPVWYQLDASGDGSLNTYAGARDVALVNEAHAQSPPVLVIPLVNNSYTGAGFDPAPVSTIIHDPARRAAHIDLLLNETLAYNYDGIDIDYESLDGHADRDAFSTFIQELAAALHAHDKLLSIAVHPKTGAPGSWDGSIAQDWAAIGAAADRFRIMTYGYHWSGSEPGPIAPLWWMENVIAHATSVVSPNHVYAGIHLYGHDWNGAPASSLTWESAQTLISAHNAPSQWKTASPWWRTVAEPWFAYTDDLGQPHQVWYANKASVTARLELAQRYGLGGVALWRIGGEDPAIWSTIE